MRLSRIFRKYSRVLLLVFMSLLLVVFLIGDVISRAARSASVANIPIGEAFGREITTRDMQRLLNDLDLLERRLRLPPLPVVASDQRDRELAEYLLFEEARQMGIRVDRQQAVELLRARGITDNHLAKVRDDTRRSLESIYALVGTWLSVVQAERLQMEVLGDSLPRIELAYRDQNQEASVRLSVIESRAFLPLVPEPTEEEIQAYFNEARDRETAHEEDRLVFGYRQPDRVQLEYLTVDPAQIENDVRVSRKEALRFYAQNRDKYKERVPRPTTQATRPARPEYDEIQRTFEEVEKRVRDDCRRAKAVVEAQGLVNEMQQEAVRPWLTMARDEQGFRVAPPAEAIVSFEALRDKYQHRYRVIYGKTELLDEQGLRRAPGIGRASFRLGSSPQRITTATMALRVKGLMTPERDDPLPVLNLLEPSRVLFEVEWDRRTRQQVPRQAYFFRVVRVVPSGPPESLEVVRDQLVKDLKLMKAHELAGQYARRLAEQARAVGLEAAVAGATELRQLLTEAQRRAASQPLTPERGPIAYLRYLGPFTPPGRFTRIPSYVQYVGTAPSLHRQVFALGPADASSAPAHRVALTQVAEQQKWVVAELEQIKPIYAGDFEKRLSDFSRRTQYQAAYRFRQAWYDAANILKRTRFVRATPQEE